MGSDDLGDFLSLSSFFSNQKSELFACAHNSYISKYADYLSNTAFFAGFNW